MSDAKANTSMVSASSTSGSGTSSNQDPPVVTATYLGPKMAYDAISQSAAIVIQDAAMLLRQITAMSIAAMAVCTEQLVKTQDQSWVTTFGQVTANLKTASDVYSAFGGAAHDVMAKFQPSDAGAAPGTDAGAPHSRP